MLVSNQTFSSAQAGSTPGSAFELSGKISLSGWLEYFLLACKTEGKTPQTLQGYKERVGNFVIFNGEMAPADVTSWHLRAYLATLQDRKLAPSTISGTYRAIHRFFVFLMAEGAIQQHPMNGMRPPRVPRKLHKGLTADEIKRVMMVATTPAKKDWYPHLSPDSARGNFLEIRNKAIFLTFLDTGLRLAELAGIQREHVDLERGSIIVHGKGGKERRVCVGKMTRLALMKWYVRSAVYKMPGLWLTEEKTQLGREGVQMAIRRMLRRSGITGKIGPHTLRHTAAQNYLRNGGDLATLQVMLGHSDISTTQIYLTDIASDDVQRVHEKASPVDRLGLK